MPLHTTVRPRSIMVWRSAMRDQRRDVLVDHQNRLPGILQLRTGIARFRRGSAAPDLRSLRPESADFGLVISARPITSICCSPPDKRFAMLSARSLSRGNSSHNLVLGPADRRRSRRVGGGGDQIFPHGEIGKNLAPFRHQTDAKLGDAIGRAASWISWPSKRIEPRTRRCQPHDRAHCRGLAHAVAAHQRDHLARTRWSSDTPNSTWLQPITGFDVFQRKQSRAKMSAEILSAITSLPARRDKPRALPHWPGSRPACRLR